MSAASQSLLDRRLSMSPMSDHVASRAARSSAQEPSDPWSTSATSVLCCTVGAVLCGTVATSVITRSAAASSARRMSSSRSRCSASAVSSRLRLHPAAGFDCSGMARARSCNSSRRSSKCSNRSRPCRSAVGSSAAVATSLSAFSFESTTRPIQASRPLLLWHGSPVTVVVYFVLAPVTRS